MSKRLKRFCLGVVLVWIFASIFVGHSLYGGASAGEAVHRLETTLQYAWPLLLLIFWKLRRRFSYGGAPATTVGACRALVLAVQCVRKYGFRVWFELPPPLPLLSPSAAGAGDPEERAKASAEPIPELSDADIALYLNTPDFQAALELQHWILRHNATWRQLHQGTGAVRA